MKVVRWGILGLGKIANKFATDLQSVEYAEIAAVASRDINKAKEFASIYGVNDYFDDYTALIRSNLVDVMYIATPHFNHAALSILCLQNGIAVLCEKPMSMSVAETELVLRTAKENNVFFMEAMWTRFIPAFDAMLHKVLVEKVIGDVQMVKADFGFNTPFVAGSRIFDKALGASALLDVGIYPVYLAIAILGAPTKIQANADLGDDGVDRTNNILLSYPNGAMANLFSSFAIQTKTEATIYGTKGNIYLYPRFHHTKTFVVNLDDGSADAYQYPYLNYGYNFEIHEVCQCILEGKTQSTKMTWADSLLLSQTLEAISAEIGI
jgi:predicted dehydrogenase